MPLFAYRPSRGNRGFAYIALLAVIVIIGISTTAVVRSWSGISHREKEKELLFRGDQYRTAIERYTKAMPGLAQFPQSIDDLLRDKRTSAMKRHLRQKYNDPISGEDFTVMRDPATNRIIGIHSPSEKEPLKQANFPEQDKAFEGKTKYTEWEFVYKLPPGQPGGLIEGSGGPIRGRLVPGAPGATGTPGTRPPLPPR